MSPKSDIQQAIILRDAGLTLSTISDKTGLSASTLYREFKKHKVKRGGLTKDSLDEARETLLHDAGFIDDLKHSIASSLVDDMSLARRIRESVTLTLDEIANDSTMPAVLKSRSLAALSTSLKITQEINFKALSIEDFKKNRNIENMPALQILPYTPEEIEKIQKSMNDEDDDSVFDNDEN